MQFFNKNITVRLIVLLALPFFFSSCLKKIEEVDELNTNIFDREYEGGQWFVVDDVFQLSNELGELKVRFEVVIPSESVPELKPSNIKVHAEGDGLDVTVYDFPLTGSGDYKAIVDLPYLGLITYCIKLGVYIEDENAAINLFSYCKAL